MKIPVSHPRRRSLEERHRITNGLENGIVASAGLIAHGRGEAFDYLLGERTSVQARKAERAAVCMLLAAKRPVISVNGNVAALCPKEVVKLAKAVGARLEVNLFYRSRERLLRIRDVLYKAGAGEVFGVGACKKTVPGLSSERARADRAILDADVVLVMLEDGDRTEALKRMGKRVIAVDLNPLSRTACKADISVVDNVVRAIPNMAAIAAKMSGRRRVLPRFDNAENLREMERLIRRGI